MTENNIARVIGEAEITNGGENVVPINLQDEFQEKLKKREAFVKALALIEQLVAYDKTNLRIDERRISVGMDDVEVLSGGSESITEPTTEYKQKVIDSLVRKQIRDFDKEELTAFVDLELTAIGQTIERLKADEELKAELIEATKMISNLQEEIEDIFQAFTTNSEVDVNTTGTSALFRNTAQHMTYWFGKFEEIKGSIFLFNQKKEALLAMKAASQDTTEHFTSEQTQLLEKIKEATYTSLDELLADLNTLGDTVVTTTYEVSGSQKMFNGRVDLITGSQIAAGISSIERKSIKGSLSKDEIARYLKNHAVTNEYNIRNTATALLLAQAEAKKKAGVNGREAKENFNKSEKERNSFMTHIKAFFRGE